MAWQTSEAGRAPSTCLDLRRIADLGEFALLDELERRALVQEIADDAAVLEDGIVVTQDTLVQGVHFRLEWTSWHDLGYKAAAVNLSDLAAMGAAPRALLVSLVLPAELLVRDTVGLYEGLNEPGVKIVGGDTSTGPVLALSVTAVGRSDRVPGRGGAEIGDALVVTGALGGAAAGLDALRRGLSGFDELARMHNRPPLRLEESQSLAARAHALIDLSDGLAADAGHVARQSGCELVIEVDDLPVAPRIAEVGDAPYWLMGEDYELLAVLAPADAKAAGFPIIGDCREGAGVTLLRSGEPMPTQGGWEHFQTGA